MKRRDEEMAKAESEWSAIWTAVDALRAVPACTFHGDSGQHTWCIECQALETAGETLCDAIHAYTAALGVTSAEG